MGGDGLREMRSGRAGARVYPVSEVWPCGTVRVQFIMMDGRETVIPCAGVDVLRFWGRGGGKSEYICEKGLMEIYIL